MPCVIFILILTFIAHLANSNPNVGAYQSVTDYTVNAHLKTLFYAHDQHIFAEFSDGSVHYTNLKSEKWMKSTKIPSAVKAMGLHDHDKSISFFFTANDETFMSKDSLETVYKINTEYPFNDMGVGVFDFHPTEKEWLIFVASDRKCQKEKCATMAYFSKDNGLTWNFIEDHVEKCLWALDVHFGPEIPPDSIYCMTYKDKTQSQSKLREQHSPMQLLLFSNGLEKLLCDNTLQFYVVQSVLVVSVRNSQLKDNEASLLVSLDGLNFHATVFPPNLHVERNSFTMLDSNATRLVMDIDTVIKQPDVNYGTLFISNSNATFYSKFLEHTHRSPSGNVDFVALNGDLAGIMIANQIQNLKQIVNGAEKQIQTRISSDYGATWSKVEPPLVDSNGNSFKCSGDCALNLHLVLSSSSSYQVPSKHYTSNAPNMILGVGNVGSELKRWNDCDLFMSRDAGRTWNEIKKDAHKWAVLDHGSTIVVANDETQVSEIEYTTDYGKTWVKQALPGSPLRVISLSTDRTTSSTSVVVAGYEKPSGDAITTHLITVNLALALKETTCADNQIETWSPTLKCFLGKTLKLKRKVQDAACMLTPVWSTVSQIDSTLCECTDKDFECDYNFWLSSPQNCVLLSRDENQPQNCKKGEKYQGPSGYRKISLSQCQGGIDKSGLIERECDGYSSNPGQVFMSVTQFDQPMIDYVYLNASRTVLFLDSAQNAHLSLDEGKSWQQSNAGKHFTTIHKDKHNPDRAFLIPLDDTLVIVAAKVFTSFNAPLSANSLGTPVLATSFDDPNHLIWNGKQGCNNPFDETCYTESFHSADGGTTWNSIGKFTQNCAFVNDFSFKRDKNIIYCQFLNIKQGHSDQRTAKNDSRLAYSTDFGKRWTVVFPDSVSGFAVIQEFLVCAVYTKEQGESPFLQLFISLDGKNFASAKFPSSNFKIMNPAYTMLESTFDNIFLDVLATPSKNNGWGSLFISNYNGTFYSLSLENTNRDSTGFVDFEKIYGVEGVAVANQVVNTAQLSAGGGGKKELRSKITFNNGKSWQLVNPPALDSNGKPTNCLFPQCSLNLRAFNEKHDQKDSFSTLSAVGLMVAQGNIGQSLVEYDQSNVYLTRDGGASWSEVLQDAHMIEVGDHGNVILFVNDEGPTDTIKYTLDQGKTIHDLKLASILGHDVKIRISSITTQADATDGHFIVFGTTTTGSSSSITLTDTNTTSISNSISNTDTTTTTSTSSSSTEKKSLAIYLDFESIWARQCSQDLTSDDYEIWSPKGGCLLGKKTIYYRRKQDRHCKMAEYHMPQPTFEPCECTDDDYECDYNHVRVDGECRLIPGFSAVKNECGFVSTGYRKLKHSMCQGGKQLAGDFSTDCKTVSSFSWTMFFWFAVVGSLAFVGYKHFTRTRSIRLGNEDDTGILPRIFNVIQTTASFVYDKLMNGLEQLRGLIPSRHRGYQPLNSPNSQEPFETTAFWDVE